MIEVQSVIYKVINFPQKKLDILIIFGVKYIKYKYIINISI